MPTGCRSVYLFQRQQILAKCAGVGMRHLLVISKVVPKIWARTNSAMMTCWTRQVESKERSKVKERYGAQAKTIITLIVVS